MEISTSVGFIVKKVVTMHGHVNVTVRHEDRPIVFGPDVILLVKLIQILNPVKEEN